MGDDHGEWAMGCSGNSEVKTPNLDRLAEAGIRFKNFFCVSPVCSPARASIFTGKIPSAHGVHDWLKAGSSTVEADYDGRLIQYMNSHLCFTELLEQSGYTCGISGKWHLGDSHHPQKGFSYWKVHAKGGDNYYNAPMIEDGEVYYDSRYVTDVITENALSFLDEQKNSTDPFYLSVHYTAPHSPWHRDQHPEALYDEYRNNCTFESTPLLQDPPEWVTEQINHVYDESGRRDVLSGYYTAITAMDKCIGQLIDRLKEQNLIENTIIIYTSDNGMNMGHHGLWGKGNASYPMNMFDESVKVPMIISYPAVIENGSVCESLLSHYDLFPTILDLTGTKYKIPEKLPGKSCFSLLKGETSEQEESIVVFDEYGPVRMIRSQDWKYIHRILHGPHELYNLNDDPGESVNLIDNPDCQAVQQAMKNELNEWFRHYSVEEYDGAALPVKGRGQLGPVNELNSTKTLFL